ncbi:MAG: hypothetical protein LBU32_14440 [Clostridiales bacterium]|jgi:hypothetical protein|nr:hypothetical protein [Clostridiales bacterium]
MILERLFSALSGRRLWLKLKRKYDFDSGVFALLMPEDDIKLNFLALKHIKDLLEYRRASGVVILSANEWVLANAIRHSGQIIDIVQLSEKSIENIISYAEFYFFSQWLITVSLDRPYGVKARQAIGVSGITLEDMVCLGIYCIRNWTSMEA